MIIHTSNDVYYANMLFVGSTVYQEIYTSVYICKLAKLKILRNKFLRIQNLQPRPCLTSTIQLRMRVHVVHIFTK